MNQCLLEDNMRMIRIGIDSCSRGRAHQIVVPVRLSHSSRGIECDQLLKNFSKLQSPTVAKKTSNLKRIYITDFSYGNTTQFLIPNMGGRLNLLSQILGDHSILRRVVDKAWCPQLAALACRSSQQQENTLMLEASDPVLFERKDSEITFLRTNT